MIRSIALRRMSGRGFALYAALVFILVTTLFPFYWMVVTSVKSTQELYNVDANPFIALSPTLEHYSYLFGQTLYLTWLKNTMIVTVGATAISMIASIPAGYALARLRFPGASVLGSLIFITYLVPPTLLFIPMVRLVGFLGLSDTLWSLILVYPTFLIPFGTWLLTGYFRSIPRELEESALVDGCGKLGAMVRIAVPLALPGLLSVGIFSFTLSWNEFLYALTLISDPALKTVPVGAPEQLMVGDAFRWGELMGAALLGSLPVAFFYSFFVDYFVAGMTAGAVKG
ncbi:MAG: carbohydrate ABC transporter permease [Chloroflexi bacterium]|nr:carbohydrate ABC transporter permease [Chloroflexota bacterium]